MLRGSRRGIQIHKNALKRLVIAVRNKTMHMSIRKGSLASGFALNEFQAVKGYYAGVNT